MNKIVINSCYGGFDVSIKAVEWMIEKGLEKKYYSINPEYTSSPDWVNKHCLSSIDIPRHHSLLVQAVETLGDEANGLCAELEIREIEGNKYRIKEYDGWESIELPEDVEWVII